MIIWDNTKMVYSGNQLYTHVLVICEGCKNKRYTQVGNARRLRDGDLCISCSIKKSVRHTRTFDESGKKCTACDMFKPLSEFSKDSRKRLGVRPYCKKCNAEKSKKRRDKDRDKARSQSRSYQRRRRARKHNSVDNFTQPEWESLVKSCNGECLACGDSGQLQPDHVIPLSKGGADSIDNIQPLCGKCNREKQANTVDYRG